MIMSMHHINEYEQDLFFELEEFERSIDIASENRSKRYTSSYQIAEIEGETEQLQDYINTLILRNNEYKEEIENIKNANNDLYKQNQILLKENKVLNKKIDEISISSSHNDSIEVLFSEACIKLSHVENKYKDICSAKDNLSKELEYEKKLRIHIEKERDAFSAAYEESILHFDKWTKTKI